MDFKCLIVDDEPPAIDELKFILSQIADLHVVGSAHSAESAIKAIRSKTPDLVFLDIKMPGRDGFEVIEACESFRQPPLFIFATAYDEHAVKAFEASAVDYILKPFQADRVRESVERARKITLVRRQGSLCGQLEKLVERIQPRALAIAKISVEHKGRILLLDPDQVVFCKAENKGVIAFTTHCSYSLHGTVSLDQLASKLEAFGFFRTHRSYLVNMAFIKEVTPWFNGKYILTTTAPATAEVPVSRRRVKALKQRLGI
jgi:DNA-binding LytR/AlgR family response regulator